jgi:hypothetical protein
VNETRRKIGLEPGNGILLSLGKRPGYGYGENKNEHAGEKNKSFKNIRKHQTSPCFFKDLQIKKIYTLK